MLEKKNKKETPECKKELKSIQFSRLLKQLDISKSIAVLEKSIIKENS